MITEKDRKLLAGTKTIEDNIDKYVEAFVTLYGEDRREEITNKFKSIIFIGYQSPNETSAIINNIATEKSKIVINNFLLKHGFSKEEVDANIADKIYGPKDIDNFNTFEYKAFKDYIKEVNKGLEGRRREFYETGFSYYHNYIDKSSTVEDFIEFITHDIDRSVFNGIPRYAVENMLYCTDLSNIDYNLNYNREKSVKFLTNLGYDTSKETFDDDYKMGKFDKITALINAEEELKEDYKEVHDFLAPYKKEIEEIKSIKNDIDKKYEELLFTSLLPYFSDEDKKIVEECLQMNDKYFFMIKRTKSFEALIGSTIDSTPVIEYFSKEYDDKLNDPNISTWIKDNIKRARIKYFKNKGIDLGNDYEAYENSVEAYSVYPSHELIDAIVKIFNDNKNAKNIEYFESIPFNRDKLKEIEERGCLDREHSFNASIYVNSLTCVSPNIRIGINGLEPCNIMLIHVRDDDALDHIIAHELNHIVELSLVQANDRDYTMVTGWDFCDGQMLQEQGNDVDTIHKNDRAKRTYELINEIINEKLAQRVSHIMEDSGSYVFCHEGYNRIEHTTGYESSFFLISEFLDTYLDTIIESRKNNNIQVIFDKVGKENFDELSSLFKVFNEHFSEFKWYKFLSDRQEGIVNEDTKVFESLISKRDEILAKMHEYALSSKTL